MVDRRLDRIGAAGFNLDKVDGGYRFSVQVGRSQFVGRGASKADAVRDAMAKLPH